MKDDKAVLEEKEIKFSKEIDKFKVFQVHSPIALFMQNFKYEKLQIEAKTQQEHALRLFLLMMEMEKLKGDEGKSTDYVRNIV